MTEVDNVSSSGFWQASLGGVQVDGKDLGATSKVAILDTGYLFHRLTTRTFC